MNTTRREFLGGLPKTVLKLSLTSQALSGLARLVFAEEDYLSKLPPLNERKVTEELIEKMLNVGSVRGILEKYGNKENVFYVQFQPDGRNNLDELVKKEPEKWDGSYVLVSDNISPLDNEFFSIKQAVVVCCLARQNNSIKFIYYDTKKDSCITLDETNKRYVLNNNHFLVKLFGASAGLPEKIIYSKRGRVLDGGIGGPKTNKDILAGVTNESIWIGHWLYRKNRTNGNGEEIIIRYNFTRKLKEEKR